MKSCRFMKWLSVFNLCYIWCILTGTWWVPIRIVDCPCSSRKVEQIKGMRISSLVFQVCSQVKGNNLSEMYVKAWANTTLLMSVEYIGSAVQYHPVYVFFQPGWIMLGTQHLSNCCSRYCIPWNVSCPPVVWFALIILIPFSTMYCEMQKVENHCWKLRPHSCLRGCFQMNLFILRSQKMVMVVSSSPFSRSSLRVP